MRGRSVCVFCGVALAALLGWLVYGVMQSGKAAPDPGADEFGVENGEGRAPDLLREAVLEQPSERAAADSVAQTPAWRACFDLAEKDFYACIAEAGDFRLSGAEVAALYDQYSLTDPRCDFLMRRALLMTAPAQVMDFMDEFFAMDEDETRMQYKIEGNLGLLMKSDSAWIEQVAASITPQDLFATERTEGPVLAAAVIGRDYAGIAALLQEGARGDWGGTPNQAVRAIGGCTGILHGDAAAAVAFLASVVRSPTLSDDEQVGGHLVALLSFSQHFVSGSESLNCDLILSLLRDSRFRRQAARQLHSMYGLDTPRGAPAELWAPVRSEIRSALGL